MTGNCVTISCYPPPVLEPYALSNNNDKFDYHI